MNWSVPGYTVSRLIGRGRWGEVWAATEDATGGPVAVRRVPTADPPDDRWLRRLAAFRHPHVVAVRGVLATAEGLALVLELATGGLLAPGRLRSGQVVGVFAPLAEGLAAAHDEGLVHGGITARSVLFGPSGSPVLADLGLAAIAGTPPADAAEDVHALARVAAEAMTGRPLPGGPDAVRVWADQVAALGVPALAAVAICAGLSPVPGHRPSAAAFAGQLRAACPVEPVARRADPPSAPITAPILDASVAAVPAVEAEPLHRAASAEAPVRDGSAARWAVVREAGRARRRPRRRWMVLMVAIAVAAVASAAVSRSAPGGPVARSNGRAAGPDWPAVLARLDTRRSTAFGRAEPALLTAVYVGGSEPLARDTGAITVLRASGSRAEGVVHELGQVRVVRADGTSAELEVTDRMPGYRVLTAGGRVVRAEPPRGDRRMRVTMVRAGGQWLIGAMSAPAAPS